jgi:hypothetical protein
VKSDLINEPQPSLWACAVVVFEIFFGEVEVSVPPFVKNGFFASANIVMRIFSVVPEFICVAFTAHDQRHMQIRVNSVLVDDACYEFGFWHRSPRLPSPTSGLLSPEGMSQDLGVAYALPLAFLSCDK